MFVCQIVTPNLCVKLDAIKMATDVCHRAIFRLAQEGILFHPVLTASSRALTVSLVSSDQLPLSVTVLSSLSKQCDGFRKWNTVGCCLVLVFATTSVCRHRGQSLQYPGVCTPVPTPSHSGLSRLRTGARNYPVNTDTPSSENISNPEGPPPTIEPVQLSPASEWLNPRQSDSPACRSYD